MSVALQVGNEALKKSCPIPFDEGRLWKGANAAELKLDLQKHFQNITLVMDCVGCEKCKLWGKLQILGKLLVWTQSWFRIVPVICHDFYNSCSDQLVLHAFHAAGIATSLKILFSTEDCSSPGSNSSLQLERNEVIALVNLLERLSKSIEVVRTISLQIADEQHYPQGLGAIQEVVQQKLQDAL